MATPTAPEVFAEIDKAIKADPTIVPKTGGVFHFKLGDKSWTVDLKNGKGFVKQAAPEKADVTMILSEPDFVSLLLGKVNGQTLFMKGKLKIQGNMALAMKLDKVLKMKPAEESTASKPAAPSPAASSGASGFRSAAVFEELTKRIAANSGLVQQIGGIYQFEISKDGKTQQWFVDLKNGKGSVGEGKNDKAEVTLTTNDDDFVGMMTGKANSQQLFMQGKLKIKGNMGLAMKLSKLNATKAAL